MTYEEILETLGALKRGDVQLNQDTLIRCVAALAELGLAGDVEPEPPVTPEE